MSSGTPIVGGREAQRLKVRDERILKTAKRYKAAGGDTISLATLVKRCRSTQAAVLAILREHDLTSILTDREARLNCGTQQRPTR